MLPLWRETPSAVEANSLSFADWIAETTAANTIADEIDSRDAEVQQPMRGFDPARKPASSSTAPPARRSCSNRDDGREASRVLAIISRGASYETNGPAWTPCRRHRAKSILARRVAHFGRHPVLLLGGDCGDGCDCESVPELRPARVDSHRVKPRR